MASYSGYAKNRLNTLALILLSLQSIYYEPLGFAPAPVIGALLLLSVGFRFDRSVYVSGKILWALVFLTAYSTIGVAVTGNWQLFFAVLVVSGALLGVNGALDGYSLKSLTDFIGAAVVFHLILYVIQIVYWFYNSDYIDYVSLLGGHETSRYSSAKAMEIPGIGRIPRFTGAFNEPGTFATYLFILLVPLIVSKQKPRLVYVSLAAIVFSMSLYGILFAGLSAAYFAKTTIRRNYYLTFSVALVGAYGVYRYVWPTLDERLNSSYTGLDLRVGAVNAILEYPAIFLCGRCSSGSLPVGADVTLPVSIIHLGGFLLLAALIISIKFTRCFSSLSGTLFVILILLSKVKIQYPFLWVMIFIIGWVVVVEKSRTKRRGEC